MDQYKIIALVGESGSGKDTILNAMCESELSSTIKRIIPCTTRPPRINMDGSLETDYHFIDIETYTSWLLNGDLLEGTVFNNWGYGTCMSELRKDRINIGIFNSQSILQLQDIMDARCLYTVRVRVSPKERMMRMLSRQQDVDVDHIIWRWTNEGKSFRECDAIATYNYDYWNNHPIQSVQIIHCLDQATAFFGQNKA